MEFKPTGKPLATKADLKNHSRDFGQEPMWTGRSAALFRVLRQIWPSASAAELSKRGTLQALHRAEKKAKLPKKAMCALSEYLDCLPGFRSGSLKVADEQHGLTIASYVLRINQSEVQQGLYDTSPELRGKHKHFWVMRLRRLPGRNQLPRGFSKKPLFV